MHWKILSFFMSWTLDPVFVGLVLGMWQYNQNIIRSDLKLKIACLEMPRKFQVYPLKQGLSIGPLAYF